MAFCSVDTHKELLEYYIQEQEHYQRQEDHMLDKILSFSSELMFIRTENIKSKNKIKKLQNEIMNLLKYKESI